MRRDALRRLFSVTPFDEWPDEERRLVLAPRHLPRAARVRFACFMYGNGARAADVPVLMRPYLRDRSARLDVAQLCDAFARTDPSLFYYDVRAGVQLHLDGRVRQGSASAFWRRKLVSWDRYAARHLDQLSMHKERAFLDDPRTDDADLFFRLYYS